MKTSELRKWLIKNDFMFDEYETSIVINGLLTIYKETQKLKIYDESWQEGIGLELLNKAIEYTNTPLNEREDEKKYNLKYNDTCFNFMDSWLVQGSDGKFWFSVFMEGKFTQQEIDNFPAEIKGAIECGFLRKVEVE